MTKLKTVRGTGNVFRDLGETDAELMQLKALLATEIVRALNERGLTVRRAAGLSGFAAADFSRIRNADLGRFTVDRLMKILAGLGREVDVTLKVRRKKSPALSAAAP